MTSGPMRQHRAVDIDKRSQEASWMQQVGSESGKPDDDNINDDYGVDDDRAGV